ncbi:hypothetical protein NWFMUON74_44060 [Nocardia wallacei]|uniref:Uncharacterized protein n=1 Tax=Nocardia wallacei TaxID=480035 RepID=A0A7G1KU04_9NOCA|nr:hypothetical protein NWFMUON74_44060 [Nocardia wallacei]
MTKNAQRQPGPPAIRPPATTPNVPAAPPTAPKTPRARLRSRPSGKGDGEQRQRTGRDERATQTLQSARGDKQPEAL